MKPHEDPCPICEEYEEKFRGLASAYGDTKDERYHERMKQVVDTVVKEHLRQGITARRQTSR